jgi:hypothetical protein
MKIDPQDQNIIKNLAFLEQTGEEGFSIFGSGDTETGKAQIKDSLNQSAKNIDSIQNSELRAAAKELFKATNEAIAAYMKNPSDENLSNLKTDVDHYKDFLDEHQE